MAQAARSDIKSVPRGRTPLFGWTVPGRGEEISATIDNMNDEMQRLYP